MSSASVRAALRSAVRLGAVVSDATLHVAEVQAERVDDIARRFADRLRMYEGVELVRVYPRDGDQIQITYG